MAVNSLLVDNSIVVTARSSFSAELNFVRVANNVRDALKISVSNGQLCLQLFLAFTMSVESVSNCAPYDSMHVTAVDIKSRSFG